MDKTLDPVVYSYPTGGVPRRVVTGSDESPRLGVDKTHLAEQPKKHNHYFKDVSMFEEIDVYVVLRLFNVTDPSIQHAVKKLLVAGGRGAGKDINKDIQESIDSLLRWQEIEKTLTK